MTLGVLYTAEISPTARSVHLLEKALGIQLEHVEIDLFTKQQLTPEFVKLNLQHTVPFYTENNGAIKIGDSHAIMTYLVSKYAKDDSLYPKDLVKRAIVDQRLHFDSEKVFGGLRPISFPMMFGELGPSPRQKITVEETYEFMDGFLRGQKWMAGDHLTIADLSLITSLTALSHIVPIDSKLTNLLAWVERCKQLPYYASAAGKGDEVIKNYLHDKMRTLKKAS